MILFLPALVLLKVGVDDVGQGKAEKTEACLNYDPEKKIRKSGSNKVKRFYRVIIRKQNSARTHLTSYMLMVRKNARK